MLKKATIWYYETDPSDYTVIRGVACRTWAVASFSLIYLTCPSTF